MTKYLAIVNVFTVGGFGKRIFKESYEYVIDKHNDEELLEILKKIKKEAVENFINNNNYEKEVCTSSIHQVIVISKL